VGDVGVGAHTGAPVQVEGMRCNDREHEWHSRYSLEPPEGMAQLRQPRQRGYPASCQEYAQYGGTDVTANE
jgi:hypothetical protein